MSGRKLTNASQGVTNPWPLQGESIQVRTKGWYNLSFTEMDTTTEPAIAAGSSVDIDGTPYIFDAEEAITGSPSDGVVYVIVTGGAAASASFTNTALPDYDYIKKGYYGVSGERYIAEYYFDIGNWKFITVIDEQYQAVTAVLSYIKQNNNFLLNQVNNTEIKIVASDAQANDYFGAGVSIYGDYAIVGAYGEDAGGSNAGAAYIFHKTGNNTWDSGTKIVASDAQATDFFGTSVSIYGDYAIVGAYGEDTGGSGAGAAYIYYRTGTNTWDSGTKIVASDAQADDLFGKSVSIYGDYAIVGASREDAGGTDAGAAYIYYRTGTNTWDSGTKIVASDAEAGDYFGKSVSIYGDYAIVGAYGEDTGGSNAGAAYIFHKTGNNTWDSGTKIVASDAQANDYFGMNVSIYGNYAIVGADGEDAGGSSAGAAYIYYKTGNNTWDSGTKIVASDAQADDCFGAKVSIYDDYAIVGADREDAGGSYAGAAYIFHKTGNNTWDSGTKIVASDAQADDYFGAGVSIYGDYAIVGAYGEDTGGSSAGAAYIYQIPYLG